MKTLAVCALLVSATALADSPFDGTWVSREDTAVQDKKPYKISLAKGVYQNDGPVPPVKVKADGTDQPVKGHAYYDTLAVNIAGPEAIEVTSKKDGKVAGTSAFTLDSSGKTLTNKWTDQTTPTPSSGEVLFERVGKGPAGSHAISGSWRITKIQNFSATAKTVSYKASADGMSMSTPAGISYEAKFDGKDSSVSGDPGGTMVSLKRVNASTIVETDKRKGKVVEVDKMTVAADGKTMKVEWDDRQSHRKGSFTMDKSP